ncbi:uncharacterized protein LOC132547546 [Ylistrum balloti]|uniref:uncharacterized protein LOC132547546 n=1 Tax=Ylistrum balloti TaxID=509963 RepID=UPI002905AC13|nr:uncharacterized protein LOC132547546 [Ylistrum balloti]
MTKKCLGCLSLWLTSLVGFSLPILWMDLVHKEPVSLEPVVTSTETSRLESCMIPTHSVLESFSLLELASLYHRYLSKEQIPCKEGVRLGKAHPGGWDVCIDEEFRLVDPCIVYSFGIRRDFSFSEEITQTFGCYTYAFDPRMKRSSRRYLERLLFTSEGISNFTGYSNHRWMRTLQDIRRHYGHNNKTIDVITLDITPTELIVIPHALQNGDLETVKQLNVRLGNPDYVLKETTEEYINRLNVLRDLCFVGFRSWIISENNKCRFHSEVTRKQALGCYEISFLNLRYI